MKRRDVDFSASTNDNCNSVSCNSPIKRSVSRKKVGLCQDCYKIFKKATIKDRAMESFGR